MLKLMFVLTPAFNPNAGGVQKTSYKLGKFFSESGIEVYYYSFSKEGHVEVLFGKLFHDKEKGGCNNEINLSNLRTILYQIRPNIVINQMPYEVTIRNLLFNHKNVINFYLIGCLRNSLFAVKNNIIQYTKSVVTPSLLFLFENPIGYFLISFWHKVRHSAQLRDILDKHDYFILLAPPNLDELEYFVGKYKSDKVFVIPNSIPRVVNDVPNKENILLYVGSLIPMQKRLEYLLPIWEKVYSCAPDWKFIIVGDGIYANTLKNYISSRNLPNVEMVGFDDPDSYYAKSSIFIMTSAYEGFPNVIIEAQSFGVLPIAFNSYPVLSWIVNNGEDSFLCKPFNIDEMAGKIVAIINDKNKLQKMQKTCLVNASKFTIEKVGKIWLDFFDEICKNYSRRLEF